MIQKVKQWKSGVQFDIIEYHNGKISKVIRTKDAMVFRIDNDVSYKSQRCLIYMFHEDCKHVFIAPKGPRPQYGIEFSIENGRVTSKSVKIETKAEDMQNKIVPINEVIFLSRDFVANFPVDESLEGIQ